MKRVITYTILLLSIILTTATAHSQSYPVQANLYVMAPYSQTYSDYYADGQQRMFVNVLLNDMSQGQLDVVLRFTISGNNLKLISKPNTTAKPITILSGKLCRIEGSELAQYLKPEQMQVEGRKADEFNKSGRLPEGYYEIKVEVVEFYRKVRISAPVYTTMWIMQPEAPVWTMPQNGVRLDATNPQFVMFGWMLTNSTSLLQNVKYTFSIYAKPDDINPDVVARTTTPLYSETLTQTMLVYGPDKPLLELGGTYVCRIKAEDADGNVTFKNDGYSETLVFRYGQTCDPPKQVTITDVTKKGATVNWVESGNYSGYDIEVRETTGGKSSDWYVWNIDKQVHSYDLKQLSVSSSYECRVAAVCGQRSNGIRSQYSDVVSFKTYDAGNKNYNCGDLVEANKHEDRVPYLYLEEGDVIEANGFLFAIESISKASEGVFSGQCSWYIDLWGVSILCDFKDISINRHQQLIAGKIEACRDKVKAKAFTRLQSAAYMPIGTQVPSTFTAEKVIKMEETVDSIRIVNGQTLIYVAGKEPQKVDATDDVFVQSPDGNYYAVEGGNVYPKPSNLDSEGNRQLSYTQQLVATFGYDDAMGSHPGVDSYTDAKAPFAAQYTQYQLHSNDAYATWMAVEKYRTSMAKVTVSGGDRDSIQLRSNGQLMVRTNATEPNALYMPISTEGLYEAYYTTKDNKEKDVEVVAGQLNVTSYERNNINVCLVGVNGEFYQYSVNELSSYLNQVFGQAVTNVNLTTASIDVDKFNGTLSAKESGALSAYNSDMKKLIKKVKKLSDYNSETYYIMLVERSDDQTLGGFMPVNSNFGFVFAKANSGKEQLNRTIAHELAHGAFRLWHTFSSENIYVAQQGSTKNLMDYNGTNSELYKYQWDYIHNPEEGIVKWMVDEEEGEMVIENSTRALARIIKTINCAYNNGEKNVRLYLPSSTITSNVSDLVSELYLAGNPCAKNAKLKATLYTMFGQAIDLSNNYIDDVYSLENIEYNENAKVITLTGNDYKLLIAGENDASNVYDFAKDNLFGSLHIPKTSINFASLDDLQYSSPCELQYLSIDNRKKILQNIQSETNWYNNSLKDSRQKITINLIATTPKGDRGELLSFFYSNPSILKTLYDRVDDYRCEFIDELNNVYTDGLENISDRKIVAVGLQPGVMEQRTPWYEDLSFMWGYLYTIKNHTYAKYEADDKISVYIKKYRGVSLGLEALMADGQLLCEGHPFDVIRGVEIESKKQIDIPLFYFLYKTQEGETDAIYKDINAIGATTVDIALMTLGLKSLSGASELLKSEVTARNITRLILGFGDISTLGLDKICEDETSDFCQAYKKYEFYINMGLLSANVLNEFPEKIIKGLRKGLDNPKLSPKQKDELKAILGETSTKTAKYADNLTGELKKTYEELKTVFAPEKTSLVECIDDGKSIVFNLVGDPDIPLLEIANGKFMVKGWGAHYKGDVVKKLDNGYWVVKNGDSYSIDLGFKEGRKLTGKEVNEYYMGIGKLPPYTDDCIVTEEVLKPGKEFYMVIDGIVEEGGTNVVNHNPGGWATNDAITTIKELRDDMAVRESWKNLEFEPTRVKFRVTKDLPVRNGVVGPQFDFPSAENGQGIIYFGGSQQYEIVLPKEANWWDNGWDDYLIELERLELK